MHGKTKNINGNYLWISKKKCCFYCSYVQSCGQYKCMQTIVCIWSHHPILYYSVLAAIFNTALASIFDALWSHSFQRKICILKKRTRRWWIQKWVNHKGLCPKHVAICLPARLCQPLWKLSVECFHSVRQVFGRGAWSTWYYCCCCCFCLPHNTRRSTTNRSKNATHF